MVDKYSPFISLQKERLATQAGVKKWEDIFLQPYETAAQQAQTQAAYDISGAFAQYKQSELAAMRNTQLGSGFKEQIASDLAAQYGSAFSQIKQQEASNIYDIQQQASKTLATQEAALAENAKMYAGIEEAAFEQYGIDLERARASENAVIGKDEQGNDIYGLGYYELQPDGSYKITERGVDFFDKVFNQGLALTNEAGEITGYEQLADYLKNTGRTEEYDFYVQNLDTTREFIGGLRGDDRNYTREESIKNDYRDYVYKTEFSSKEDESKYLETVKSTIDLKNNAQNILKTMRGTRAVNEQLAPATIAFLENTLDSFYSSKNKSHFIFDYTDEWSPKLRAKISISTLSDNDIELLRKAGFKDSEDNTYMYFTGDYNKLFEDLANFKLKGA